MNTSKQTHKPCEIILPAMGGSFTYKAFPQQGISYEDVEQLFHKAHAEVERIEDKYTEFKESEVSRINDNAGIKETSIDDETMSLLEQSKKFYNLSHGLFDISYASRNKKWRESSKKKLGLLQKIKLYGLVDFSKVTLNKQNRTLFLPKRGMKIGLGGIGKGYAVDRAFTLLKKEGMINFSVNGSGDMRVHSHPEAPRPWKIGIRNPFQTDPNISAGLVQINNGSVSTSGSYIQKSTDDQSGRDHHIVARYGISSPPISCTIIADDCLSSDVWATIAMATTISNALFLLNKNALFGILIDQEGKSHLTQKALANFNK